MAKLTDEDFIAAFQPHLNNGEVLQHWALGVKQPKLMLMIPLFALAILPGAIAVQMLTKYYAIGLTQNRLIMLNVKGFKLSEVKEVVEYNRDYFLDNPAETKTGSLFTHITIDHDDKPFRAKFHRSLSKTNREHAMAIGAAISE